MHSLCRKYKQRGNLRGIITENYKNLYIMIINNTRKEESSPGSV